MLPQILFMLECEVQAEEMVLHGTEQIVHRRLGAQVDGKGGQERGGMPLSASRSGLGPIVPSLKVSTAGAGGGTLRAKKKPNCTKLLNSNVESGDIATINEMVGGGRDEKEQEEMRDRLCALVGVGGLKPWLDVFSTVGETELELMQTLSSEVSGDMNVKAAAAPSEVFLCPVEWNDQGSLPVRARWDNTSQGQMTQQTN
ncbi:hypothetical protein EV421DRAFT_1745065 [Armillaria borealis]|uniref:Uncharacterized protein n=1 Tax=Armillaria borealis TaxID=47425 RepID=A0AA39IUL2_9AGAR|nr:hypothetical protein EV421DRAFT_1745065 [Armillaria borealis]